MRTMKRRTRVFCLRGDLGGMWEVGGSIHVEVFFWTEWMSFGFLKSVIYIFQINKRRLIKIWKLIIIVAGNMVMPWYEEEEDEDMLLASITLFGQIWAVNSNYFVAF